MSNHTTNPRPILEDIRSRSEAKTKEIAASLFESGQPLIEPAYNRVNGSMKPNMPQGLYVIRTSKGDDLFMVYQKSPQLVYIYSVKADINGKLFSNWYSELSSNYNPLPKLMEVGSEIRRCDESAWEKLKLYYERDVEAMTERWENS